MTRLHTVLGFICVTGISALMIGGSLIALPDDIIFKDGFENHPPVIVSTPKTSAGINLPYSYDVDATDPDDDLLMYGLVQSPVGMVIDELSGEISWTPTALGIFPVEVLVSDGNRGSAVQAWEVEVTEIADSDKDGLPDEEELTRGTDPNNPDSDDDGLKDGAEVYHHGTVPIDFDTDGDDYGDGSEILAGTNPLDPSDFPESPADPEVSAPDSDPTVTTTVSNSAEFLYSGDNPVQTGVAEGTIDPVRASVVRGRVLNHEGGPLPAVTVTVLSHPEYGQTLSRANGMFDMVVNGGGDLTINYSKYGYLPAQRQVNATSQDWIWAPDAALVQLESIVTTVNLTQTTEDFVLAQGSVISDDRGSRQATLLFPQGIEAEMVMPDGRTEAISTLNVRATEYSVGLNGPTNMPAELPLGVGYTYCVELSVDEAISAGAKIVSFSEPVINYVENFLDFPIGAEVPVYFYDSDRGVWVPSLNGIPTYWDHPPAIVIDILGVSDGLAELDADGDGFADRAGYLDDFGITDSERQRIASLYAVGQSLWRIPLRHFSTGDYNWPPNYNSGLYPSAPAVSGEQTCGLSCETPAASVIDSQNQTLGESIGITGTPYSLNYRSDRIPGRKSAYTLDIPLMGDTCPASPCPHAIKLNVTIAGKLLSWTFPPDKNQNHVFTWDSKDAFGRTVYGRQAVTVNLGYEYPAQLCTRSGQCISDPPRTNVLWSEWRGLAGTAGARITDLGGWTININHLYDPSAETVYLGDGGKSTANEPDQIIENFAGNGMAGYSGDGGPAIEAQLDYPRNMSVGPDGSVYFADQNNNRVRKIDPGGVITTIAGNGTAGFSGDSGPAVDAMLNRPQDVAVGSDGSVFIVDRNNKRVRKVDPDGIITTFAGNGLDGTWADYVEGLPANESSLYTPLAVAIAPDQTVYVTNFYHHTWKIDTAGVKWLFAGWCNGYGGDGGPAYDACFDYPFGVAVSENGDVYLADYKTRRIRKIGLDGIVTTVAGDGAYCSDLERICGDGGPALAAQIVPTDVAVDKQGNIYIADSGAGRIRKVSPDGNISSVAGNGEYCAPPDVCGDGGLAAAAAMTPRFFALRPNGDLLYSEQDSHRIREIKSSMPGLSVTDFVIASRSGTELFAFDADGRHLQTINSLTGTAIFTFSYDGNSLLTEIEDADGNITTIERDPDGAPSALVGPFGQRTDLTLDANGYLATVSNPANEAWHFSYTEDGLLTSSTDPNEQTSSYTYDELGRLIRTDDAAGGSQTLVRTELNGAYQVTRTSGLGRTTTYRVEQMPTGDRRFLNTAADGTVVESLIGTDGRQVLTLPDSSEVVLEEGPDPRFGMQSPFIQNLSVKFPSGLETLMEETQSAIVADDPLNVASLTTSHTFAGATTEDTYSASTQTLASTSPEGRTVTITVDEQARPLQSSIPGLHPMDIAYEARGRVESVSMGSDPEVRSITFSYAADGFPDSVTDPLDRMVVMERDAVGRMIRSTLPDGTRVDFEYDAMGNLLSLTPPGRPPHLFAYDARGYLTMSTPPAVASAGPTGFTYNADGFLTTVDMPGDESIAFTYDLAGRHSGLTLTAGGIAVATYVLGWNAEGLVGNITGPGSQGLAYSYDGGLRMAVEWSGPVEGSVTSTFDDALRLSSNQVNGTAPVTYAYDGDDLLIGAGALTISRDPENGLATGTSLGLVSDSWDHDEFGNISHYQAVSDGTPLYEADYKRDALGNIVRMTETVDSDTNTYDYAYDPRGQLTEVKLDNVVVEAYAYDDNGNRLSATVDGDTQTATYDDQDRLLSYGVALFEYKPSGFTVRRTVLGAVTDYEYDPLGNLLAVTLPDGTAITYLLDGADRRVGRQVDGVPAERFLYMGQQPVAQLNASGDVVSRFVYAGGNLPTYLVRAGVTYRILTDQSSSVRLVVNTATGDLVQRMDYDAFGRVIFDSNPGFQPFGFSGGLYDPDTGLVRFGARDYEPTIGRWTAKDPIGFAGLDTNLYRYVFNNPVNLIDPSGLNSVINAILAVTASVYDNLVDPLGTMSRSINNGVWDIIGGVAGVDVSPYYQESPYVLSISSLADTNSPEFVMTRMACDFVASSIVGSGSAVGALRSARRISTAAEVAEQGHRNARAASAGRQFSSWRSENALRQARNNERLARDAQRARLAEIEDLGSMTSNGAASSIRGSSSLTP